MEDLFRGIHFRSLYKYIYKIHEVSPKEAQIVFENLKKKFHCERSELRLQKKKILQIPQFFL